VHVLDLFSGIGGFSLGLERAGMRTVAFCEIDGYCRDVLAKHWPDVPCHDDITTREFREGEADVICGGFPCQDISNAGQRAGLAGERSGLWRELLRAIRLVRPRYAVVENVAALLARGMDVVLGDLAAIGHDAEWHCIPASAVGAPHRRDRVWIVAHPASGGHGCDGLGDARQGQPGPAVAPVAHANGTRLEGHSPLAGYLADELATVERGSSGSAVADADQQRLQASRTERGLGISPGEPPNDGATLESGGNGAIGDWWLIEPDVGRVANGVPARVDRLRSLGNAVVPQIPEIIGRAIMRIHRTL